MPIKNLGIVKIIKNERETISCDKDHLEAVFFQDGEIMVIRDTRKESIKNKRMMTCPLGLLMATKGKYENFDALYLYIHNTHITHHNIELAIGESRVKLNFLEDLEFQSSRVS
ncbi:MAG: hypothetical protein GF370_00840 [Candidatus Nealsonbacteria bacterium]|nr:hypothetical protein [Candidatus Nealsonbacteria bacterium]